MPCRPIESLRDLQILGGSWPVFVARVISCYNPDLADWYWNRTFDVNHRRGRLPFERARTQTEADLVIEMSAISCP
jgi:hypothetical protein